MAKGVRIDGSRQVEGESKRKWKSCKGKSSNKS